MDIQKQVRGLLGQKFEARKINSVIGYFLSCAQNFEGGNWEDSLFKAGKFIEAIVKLLWVYCGKTLPARSRDFKAGVYAQKIINEVDTVTVPEDGLRLQIPRACIFVYDITSNRGARHDSDEINPNEMDASVIMSMCSWILAELVRFSTKHSISIDKAKEIVNFLIERRYPIFEEINGRIYVDNRKFKSASECSLLLLYKLYPRRINKEILIDLLKRHSFRQTALKLERLTPYIDIDDNGNILLRMTGRKKAEQILSRK